MISEKYDSTLNITQDTIASTRKFIARYEAKEAEFLRKAETCKPRQRGAYLAHAAQAAKNADRMRQNLEFQLAWLREHDNQKENR
jgi:hypothetical protein